MDAPNQSNLTIDHNKLLNAINHVASKIDDEWRKYDYSCYKFPEVVLQQTEGYDFVKLFNFESIVNLLDDPNIKNVQITSEFSDLHFKLFDNTRFYIEILNWWDRDTSIHDHGFSGVLFQLRGTGLNALYSYEEEEVISQNLRIGQVKLLDIQMSNQKDIRIIPWGRQERHAVLHIDQPTISLIIRTHPVIDLSPQLNYFPPYLLMNYSGIDSVFNKKIKYFQMMFAMDESKAINKLIETMRKCSLTEFFWYLMKLAGVIFNQVNIGILYDLIEYTNDPHEKKLKEKLIISAVAHRASQFIVNEIKPLFKDREIRLYLAVLAVSYNIEEKNQAFAKLDLTHDLAKINQIKKSLSEPLWLQFKSNLKILGWQLS